MGAKLTWYLRAGSSKSPPNVVGAGLPAKRLPRLSTSVIGYGVFVAIPSGAEVTSPCTWNPRVAAEAGRGHPPRSTRTGR